MRYTLILLLAIASACTPTTVAAVPVQRMPDVHHAAHRGGISNRPVGREDCDYTMAVDRCASLVGQSRCMYDRCVYKYCPTTFTHDTVVESCIQARDDKPIAIAAAANVRVDEDGTDVQHAKKTSERSNSNVAAGTVSLASEPTLSVPAVHSPCFAATGKWSRAKIQHMLRKVSMDVYNDRAHEHYTEGSQRWSGIDGHVCPSAAPKYSDCSSTVTWIYWTLFGKGTDFMNGEKWHAGYTGTLIEHGTQVSTDSLQVGDLCFYYHPMHHVAIYVGGGMVVSHGADPVGYYSVHYAPLDYCRRYV